MKKFFKIMFILTFVAMIESCFAGGGEDLKTVPSVDLNQYIGKWYEIAKYPNRFQKKCLKNTTAEYSIRNDRKIDVLNRCVEDLKTGSIKEILGKAKVVDQVSNAKLKVTFFWPFSGNYWILELGEKYEYAVIGEPSRKYLWILSRTPKMDPTLYQFILSRLESKGYDAAHVVLTPQE